MSMVKKQHVNYQNEHFSSCIRNHYSDLWQDLLVYGENLNRNWLISQEVYRRNIVPTAENDPKLFAKWIYNMVKSSGVKIKSRYMYAKSLRLLRRLRKINSRKEVSIILTQLLNAGIDKPEYAQKALLGVNNED